MTELLEDKIDDIIIDKFEIDDNLYDMKYDIKKYNQNDIIIPGISKEMELYQGTISISNTNEKMFNLDSNIKYELSGEPIILFNNFKLFGIHQKTDQSSHLHLYQVFQEILMY